MSGLVLHSLTGPDDPFTGPALDLLEELFPIEERGCRADLVEQLDQVRTLAAVDAGQVVGVVRGVAFPEQGFGWIIHIGLADWMRGRGAGAWLLQKGIDWLAGECQNYQGTVLEVEREDLAQGPSDALVRTGRIAFFTRFGARLVTARYTQPPAGAGLPCVPMNLFWLPRDPSVSAPDRLVERFYAAAFGLEESHEWVRTAVA